MTLITAPQKFSKLKHPAVFLAGSIEMGRAVNWQDEVVKKLSDCSVTLLNPRRDHWDSGWKESIANKKFKEQVSWEMNALEKSDYIMMYFDPLSKSPISLLELGLFSRSHKIFVCCPKKFWRRGNVEFVCERFNIPLTDNLEDLVEMVKERLKRG